MNKIPLILFSLFILLSFLIPSQSAAIHVGEEGDESALAPRKKYKEAVLYEKNSLYQFIKVSEVREKGERYMRNTNRQLIQGGININSPETLLLEYTRLSFIALAYLNREPKDVLFVGLGAGVMPRYFQRYYPDANIDSVEIDPDVYDAAQKYFFYENRGNMQVFISDGRIFVKKARKKYDIIFLDAYQGDHIPFHLTTREFLSEVRKILKDDGVVVSNILATNRNRFFYSMIKTYISEFPHLYCFSGITSDNFVFVTKPDKEKMEKVNVWFNAKKIQEAKNFDIDLTLFSQQYAYYTEYEKDAEILTDDFAPVNLYRHMTVE